MAYKISSIKERQKRANYILQTSYLILNAEAQRRGWDSFEKAPEKEKDKIIKLSSRKYPHSLT